MQIRVWNQASRSNRHKNGEWLVGERSKAREILYMGQTVNSQSMSTGVGVHGAAPGNWNALPATLSDRPTASTGYLRPSASANESSTSTLGDRRYGSSFGSFYTFGGDSSFTTNHQHGHGLVATSSSTTVKPQTWPLLSRRGDKISLSSEKQVQGMHKFQSRTRSEQLISIMVQPPISIAYSTRVTGPYFESESNRTMIHITARAGRTVMMDCAVILLQGRTVSWLRRKEDSLQLLTVGNTTYNGDSRLGLRFRYPNNWRLGIESVNKGDEGEYQCQLSTHPPKALIYHLKVIAPAVIILDENGHSVIERHYKVDSSLHLTCRASHVEKLVENVIWLKGDSILPAGDSRIKVK
ncbi:unnamed protein product [Orchesella dallaii]|uniref:Ig-like domain-containing protein n=1 Tax=Orchesella dallaii TaxID=48710 RepID=A0ABP1QKH8_9HEXA